MEVCAQREPPSALKRKRAPATPRDAFQAKKTEFLAVGVMSSDQDRNALLHQRFKSELDAVRGLLSKATATTFSAASPSTPRGKIDNQRDSGAVEPSRPEEPPAKRRKASPPPVVARAEEPKMTPAKKMSPAEREQLATDLAELAAELPAHIVELLLKQSNPCCGGEIEIDIHSMEGAAVLELKKQMNVFVQERSLLHAAMDSSGGVIYGKPSPQQRQDVKSVVVEEEEEDVDICGGVSPLAIAPPVVIPSPSSSGSGSSSDSGDSDSDDESSSSSDESVSSPAAAETQEKSPEQRAITPPMAELVARARESMETERKEQRSRAREKARQELLEMERTAMTSDFIDPIVAARHRPVHGEPADAEGVQEQEQPSYDLGVEEDLHEGWIWL